MIVAMFAREAELARALAQLRATGIGPLETYTPAPLEREAGWSPIPLIVLAAALLGAFASMGLQTWSSASAYRFDIGGRPDFSWASFIPTAWENAALIAIVAGFLAFLAINRMPRLYEPVDEAEAMRRASIDRWVVQIASDDAAVLARAVATLRDLGALSVEELPP